MLLNMGKKNRRRDKALRGPSAAAKTQIVYAKTVEENDPSYKRFQEIPKEIASMLVKHRFGGTGDSVSVKITVALVREIREARARSGCDAFEGEKEIWDARDAMALGDSDGLALDEYIGAVVGLQFIQILMKYDKDGKLIGKEPGVECYPLTLEIVNLWPRVRPHWKRFRRRLCHNCPACAHLTEPRYMVCSGCGVARYCSEKCQREHWPRHQQDCLTCQWLEKLKSASEKADNAPR